MTAPAGRVFAIGDVHGCASELTALLSGLELTTGDTIIFVGDYVDRGPDSRGVVDVMLDVEARSGIDSVFLKGNHEDMLLAYLGRPGHWGEAWLSNGGRHALVSYGLHPEASPAEVVACMPAQHLRFFETLRTSHTLDGWLIVHAGVRPDRKWSEQDEEDLLWIREEFIDRPHGLPQTVVFGHTPQRSVLVDLPYKIGIDTGCVYGGSLTALELSEREVFQVRRGERRVRRSPLVAPRAVLGGLFGSRRA